MNFLQEIKWNIREGDLKWLFIGIYRDIRCLMGCHDWSSWSAYALCNVQELNENPEKCRAKDGMAICERRCHYCEKPMPQSRQGEKHYKIYQGT